MRARRRDEGPLEAFFRVSWGRRIETGLAFVATTFREVLLHLPGWRPSGVALALGAGVLITAPPTRQWLVEALVRERLERRFAKAIVRTGLEPTGIVSMRPVPAGTALTISVPEGSTAEDYEKASEALAVCFRARGVRVARDPADAARAELTIVTRDPFAGPGTAWAGTQMPWTDVWSGLPIGVDEDGEAVWLELAGHHVLVGGEPGAGKSNALSMVVATAALDPFVELWCLDAKLVELAPWRDLAKAFVGPDIAEATATLAVLQAEMTARYEWLLREGLRKVTPETGLGLIVLVVDELALYIQGKGRERDEFALALRDLVARGRAAGIVVVAATQKPASDIVPTALRDLFGYRLALRCSTREASDTVLGSGWAAAGFSAADIDPGARGVGLLLADTGVPRRLRCDHLTDADIEAIVARATALRSISGDGHGR
jgi:hypothetical protein